MPGAAPTTGRAVGTIGGNVADLWLSEAAAAAERRASGQGRFPAPWARVRAWLRDHPRVSAALAVAAPHGALLVPALPLLPRAQDAAGFVSSLWQVQATVVSLALVVLVLVVETIHRGAEGDFVWRRFAREGWPRFALAFLVLGILAEGTVAFLLLPAPPGGTVFVPPGLDNLPGVALLLFAEAVLLLLQLFFGVFRYLDPGYVRRLTQDAIAEEVERSVADAARARRRMDLLRRECEQLGLEHDPWAISPKGFKKVEWAEQGTVGDVNLTALRNLAAHLAPEPRPRGVFALGPGSSIGPDGFGGVFLRPGDRTPANTARAHRCVKLVQPTPATGPDFETLFGVLTVQGLRAIQNGRADHLRDAVEALVQPVRHALEVRRRLLAEPEPIVGADDIASQWAGMIPLFGQHRRLMEVASRSPDGDVVLTAAEWADAVMTEAFRARDVRTFSQAARAITELYELARSTESPAARRLLGHRSTHWLAEFGWLYILGGLDEETDAAAIDALTPYARVLLRALADMVRQAVDAQDWPYVEQATHALWRVADIELLASIAGVDLEPFPGQEEEEDAATRARRALLRDVAGTRAALALAVAAWLCHRVRSGRVALAFAQQVLALIRGRLGDAGEIWTGLAAALEMDRSHDLDLSRWHRAEAREGELTSYSGGADIALAFVVLVLPVLAADLHARIAALAPLRNASWATELVEGALTELRPDPARWEHVVGEPVEAAAEDALRRLMAAAVADEDRRDREALRSQPLDTAKVAAFAEGFRAGWRAAALMRRRFDAAGAVEVARGALPHGHTAHVRRYFVGKGRFVEKPRALYLDEGSRFGSQLAAAEDQSIRAMLDKKGRRVSVPAAQASARLAATIKQMRAAGRPPDAVLVRAGVGALELLRGAPDDAAPGPEDADDARRHGSFEQVPVYMAAWRPGEAQFSVVSLSRLGRLVVAPGATSDGAPDIRISAFDLDTATRLAAGDRATLPAEYRAMPAAQLVDRLQEDAIIEIENRFALQVADPRAIRHLVVPDAPPGPGEEGNE